VQIEMELRQEGAFGDFGGGGPEYMEEGTDRTRPKRWCAPLLPKACSAGNRAPSSLPAWRVPLSLPLVNGRALTQHKW